MVDFETGFKLNSRPFSSFIIRHIFGGKQVFTFGGFKVGSFIQGVVYPDITRYSITVEPMNGAESVAPLDKTKQNII